MLSNRWRYFLINLCFVSRSVCFLQLPLFLLSSSSSSLFLTLLWTWIMFFSRFTVCRCVCSDTHSYSSCALLAVAEVFLLLCPRPRPALTCLYVPLQPLHCSSNFPETSKSFLFVLLTGPNVTQDFRASPGAARQVAGGGPRQVWPRPPMYQTEPSSHLSLYGLNCSWRFQQLTHLLQVYTTLSCSLQSDPHDQCLLLKHKSAETFRLVGLNLSVSLRHNAVLMFWFSLGTRTTWSGSENILVWIKILVLVTTITDGEESESESESESELL